MPYIILLLIFILTGCQTGFYQGPPSDHFNGKKFFYPGEENQKPGVTSSLYNLLVSVLQHPWPKKLPEIHYPELPNGCQDIKVTFINHSSVLIQTSHTNFLINPIYSKRVSPFSFIGPARHRQPGINKCDLPRIDAVLISHNHYDHMDVSYLKELNQSQHPLFIVPLGDKIILNHAGIDSVIELDWWSTIPVKNAEVTFLPAHHSSQRWLHDYNKTLWGSYGIQVEGKKIYFAGDTGYADHFHKIRECWGRPDFAFLPIGAYEPRTLLACDHLDPKEAVKTHIELGSRASLGIHWGTFQLSSEKMDQPPLDLALAREQAHIAEEEFFVIREGDPFYIKK